MELGPASTLALARRLHPVERGAYRMAHANAQEAPARLITDCSRPVA
jgi:hypothetical protein